MFALLLAVIYIAFISLGLPDSLFGCAWPVMQAEFSVPVSYAGLVTMTIAGGTVISSLLSDRLTRRFSAKTVTTVSVFLTAAALFGFSSVKSYGGLFIWAVPYGLGAGAIDAALNNYVAVHYQSKYMNWLHCFWGVGTMAGPYIMGQFIEKSNDWRKGYGTIGIIQSVILLILIISLPLWKINGEKSRGLRQNGSHMGIGKILKIRGVKYIFLTMAAYCSLEATEFAWTGTYLVSGKGFSPDTAARFVGFLYIGITAGRFFSGFISDRAGDRNMIRGGLALAAAGIAVIIFSDTSFLTGAGIFLLGLGCAPVYPALIHSVPVLFGEESSQSVVGVQMASAYFASTFVPPVFGLLANRVGAKPFPLFLTVFLIISVTMGELLYIRTRKKENT